MTPRHAAELAALQARVAELEQRLADLEAIPITTVAARRRDHRQGDRHEEPLGP